MSVPNETVPNVATFAGPGPVAVVPEPEPVTFAGPGFLWFFAFDATPPEPPPEPPTPLGSGPDLLGAIIDWFRLHPELLDGAAGPFVGISPMVESTTMVMIDHVNSDEPEFNTASHFLARETYQFTVVSEQIATAISLADRIQKAIWPFPDYGKFTFDDGYEVDRWPGSNHKARKMPKSLSGERALWQASFDIVFLVGRERDDAEEGG